MHIVTIVLAAGSSSRMGTSKQLLDIKGEPMLVQTVKTVLACKTENIVVVLGSQAAHHAKLLEALPVDVIENPVWNKGIGSSIKKGLTHALTMEPNTDGVLFLVCDQPYLTGELVNAFIKYNGSKSIFSAYYDGSPGVPALFTKKHFNEILALEDHLGAKKIIQNHLDETDFIDFSRGMIDLDTPEDYQNYLKQAD
ncbi:MAG TPA: nucleotidyltransferase family protein [Ohtaekwangia sp.]|nr:nucleotidyltransferase family protein [Ohtaekwangia sp.]